VLVERNINLNIVDDFCGLLSRALVVWQENQQAECLFFFVGEFIVNLLKVKLSRRRRIIYLCESIWMSLLSMSLHCLHLGVLQLIRQLMKTVIFGAF
jgi:hypothetical protein